MQLILHRVAPVRLFWVVTYNALYVGISRACPKFSMEWRRVLAAGGVRNTEYFIPFTK